MSTIQLSGLQSGIDTQSIISQLVAVEKRRLTMYQNKQTTLEEKQTALGEVKTKCIDATTIDGILYLSEMTTFLAENPRNNYFYEKTILNP